MRARKLIAAGVAALVAVAAPAAQAAKPDSDPSVVVCNEAENSHRGGYVVNGGPVDPNPPAFLRGSTMRVGKGAGLVNAALHSPALRTCGPEDGVDPEDPTDPEDPGDGGGMPE